MVFKIPVNTMFKKIDDKVKNFIKEMYFFLKSQMEILGLKNIIKEN